MCNVCGFLDSVLSRALLRGFISAVAIVIMIEQLLVMFKLSETAAKDGIGHASDCFEAAVLISVIGFVETIVVTKTYATKHNYAASTKLPISWFQDSIIRAINASLVLLYLLFLLGAFYYLPKPVLAAIVTVAAISLLEEFPHDLYFMHKIKAWKDFALLFSTFFSTIFISIEYGTLISIALSRQEEFGDMSVHPSEEARAPPIENVIFDIETMEDIDASAVQFFWKLL
ncbi:sulfate transporter family-domain-containing protein [Rhizophagus irregularis DAOM 181602=DAOM 197198]|nr:sulfate transporter family-domain-containing protein [Rhizophagus irregularis DAOM 181602=DAOM 197198]